MRARTAACVFAALVVAAAIGGAAAAKKKGADETVTTKARPRAKRPQLRAAAPRSCRYS